MTRGRAVSLHRTSAFDLPTPGGASTRILLAVPDEPAPPSGFPVLYLLDGGAYFGTLVEMVRLRRNRPAMTGVEACIVVGVAHPEAHPWDRERRRREFTPAPGGDAEAFRRLLHEELQPRIETDTPADPERRVLLGHSLAAAFVLDTWLESPGRYDGMLAVSPSIWAFRERLFGGLARVIDAAAPPRPRLRVAVGQYDQELAPWQLDAPDPDRLRARREERRMVDDAREWCERAAAASGPSGDGRPSVHFEVFAGEDHASVLPAALTRSLRPLVGIR
ncbi:alpha/beta hydrolase-fold protein [Gaopeijia maritima]|uniref:alpha/beta hydrolase n=1 Tax=Gaopeijia maritima TaxID=3119007 RepID=UPI0032453569